MSKPAITTPPRVVTAPSCTRCLIGWGSTAYADGSQVSKGDRISQELADALLAGRLERVCRLLTIRSRPQAAAQGGSSEFQLPACTSQCS
jgi:hypothetical protein